MNWFQAVAQFSVERLLNAVPEGILIAIFAWALLRALRRQNAGTRFAVWFLALLTIATLPMLAAFSSTVAMKFPLANYQPAITIPDRWALVVFLAWALGATVAIIRLMAGFWRLRQLRRTCVPIIEADLDPLVRKTLEELRGQESGATAIALATSEDIRVPAAIGFWKRTIVLPAWALRELPPSDLKVILLHEAAHLRRADDWTNLVQKIVRALFFFHPAVWWIERQLSVEREMACDDAVLAKTANPHGYATCLVSLLEKSLAHRLASKPWSMAQAVVNRAREVSVRLAQILDSNRPPTTGVSKPAVGMISGFVLLCLMASPVAPQFVAFDRGTGDSAPAHSIASSRASLQSSWRGPAVIPAAFHPGEPSMTRMTTKVGAHAGAGCAVTTAKKQIVRASATSERRVEARLSSIKNVNQVEPKYRTVVLIEATEYGNLNDPIWSVQVWHVIFVSNVQQRATVSPANSI